MRPGWLEIVVALVTYLALGGLIVLWIVQTPDEQAATRGIVGMMANGVAGVLAFLAAPAIRIRDLRAFGFKWTSVRWLLAATALGVVAFGLSVVIETVYFHFITEPNTRGDFQAAAKPGRQAGQRDFRETSAQPQESLIYCSNSRSNHDQLCTRRAC